MKIFKKKPIHQTSQLELDIARPIERDRNHHLGGKSFYFFDFDDNVAYLSTPIILFRKDDGSELAISSGDFAIENKGIGKSGKYKDYFLNFDDSTGSFRHFRDKNFRLLDKIVRKKQGFVRDVEKAISQKDYLWKAPSWNCFLHATLNNRPMSIITARGHDRVTIRNGIARMVKEGHLPKNPNYLRIYPVSNPETRVHLGDHELKASVPELKRLAIRESVEAAIKKYGFSPHHRFGMSDDDPKNVELIHEEMKFLKRRYPEMSFFVIHTKKDSFVKREIGLRGTKRERKKSSIEQLQLF